MRTIALSGRTYEEAAEYACLNPRDGCASVAVTVGIPGSSPDYFTITGVDPNSIRREVAHARKRARGWAAAVIVWGEQQQVWDWWYGSR